MNPYSISKWLRRSLLLPVCIVAWESLLLTAQPAFFYGPPEAQTNHNGNSFLAPFDTPLATPQQGRFQQVFAASSFSSLVPAGGGWIHQIEFRVDPTFGHAFGNTIPSIQLNLSTTARAVDGLSSVFQDNVGSDDTTIFGPASLTVLAGPGGFGGFYFLFSNTPFFYNPANGNLLIDFQIHQGIDVFPRPREIILDAFDVPGDAVSSVSAFGNGIPTTGQVSTIGLATLISAVPVPEPSIGALSLLVAGCLLTTWLRARKRMQTLTNEP